MVAMYAKLKNQIVLVVVFMIFVNTKKN